MALAVVSKSSNTIVSLIIFGSYSSSMYPALCVEAVEKLGKRPSILVNFVGNFIRMFGKVVIDDHFVK